MRTIPKTYLIVILVASLLAACSSEGGEAVTTYTSRKKALSFTVSVDDGASTRAHDSYSRTRAVTDNTRGNTRAGTDLHLTYKEFLVKTIKTMPDASEWKVMDNFEVKHSDAEGWQYDGVTNSNGVAQTIKYWDEGADNYMFAAVTPVPNKPGSTDFAYKDTHVTIEDDGTVTFESVKGNVSCDDTDNSSDAPDWLVARTVRTNGASVVDDDRLDANHKFHYDASQQPTNVVGSLYATVPLNFHHIMARVDFRAYSKEGSILVKKFKVMLPEDNSDKIINQGDYSTVGGWTNKTAETNSDQDPKRFGDYTYLEARTVTEDKNHPVLLASHVQIPQEWVASGRVLKVTCETSDGKVFNGTITLTAANNGDIGDGRSGWQQNKHYTYVLKIDTVGTNEVILMAVDMDVWKWIEGNWMEETETDW